MSYTQRIAPNLGQKSAAGDCLWFTWQAFGAPPGLGFKFAREAWNGQHGRHPGELPPAGVMVPVWFDHYGTYGEPPEYKNWGHAAVSLGDGRILSSPATADTFGQTIFASIADLERTLRATYLGWSECMDATPVVVATITPTGQEEDEEMAQRQAVCHTEKGVQTVIIGESSTGWKFRYTTTATKGRNPENEKWAGVFQTGDYVSVDDRSMLDAWERSLDEKRQGR